MREWADKLESKMKILKLDYLGRWLQVITGNRVRSEIFWEKINVISSGQET